MTADDRSVPSFFDAAFYATAVGSRFPDAAAAFRHYREHGVRRGVPPHPMFHTAWYRAEHPEVGDGDPLAHYLARDPRDRTPHPLFDPRWYVARYPDIARSRVDPALHYWRFGGRERRDPGPAFPTARYLAMHPELEDGRINPLAHHLARHGKHRFQPIGTVVVLSHARDGRPGEWIELQLRIENDGSRRWSMGGADPAALGLRWLAADNGRTIAGQRRPPPVALRPGERFWMPLAIPAPPAAGPMRLELALLHLDAPWPATARAPGVTTVPVVLDPRLPRRPASRWSRRERPPAAVRAEERAAQDRVPVPEEPLSRRMARADAALRPHPFSQGRRPVIRWIKGDGLDDAVTASAIAIATRLFGNRVDYCLCTNGIAGARARALLAAADQPVELRPVGPEDNPWLARRLRTAGCGPDAFGYWWKWFPERVRPDAPEWILDGDQVVIDAPTWFEDWCAGRDPLRVAQDGRWLRHAAYGAYGDLVDRRLLLYSGLVSLPPGLSYRAGFEALLDERPLRPGHDGRRDDDEQGVAAVVFQRLGAQPIPLEEFPFARASEDRIDFGPGGDRGRAWGYHFGQAFRRANRHFERMVAAGMLPGEDAARTPAARSRWLVNRGQWGDPGWSLPEENVARILAAAARHAGGDALDVGTSRGRMAALLAELGCRVTAVDPVDRAAAANLDGLGVRIVRSDGASYLESSGDRFDLVLVDLHGNGPDVWHRLWSAAVAAVRPGGTLAVANTRLWQARVWQAETGLRDAMPAAMAGWSREDFPEPMPGLAIWREG